MDSGRDQEKKRRQNGHRKMESVSRDLMMYNQTHISPWIEL
jgi:hypothetical protein